ncbi:MAG: stage II sporulation protein R [Ruminococcaceae bacterium]|nr:stage II sporulation protein R [Oscillospiraceae bacterium]
MAFAKKLLICTIIILALSILAGLLPVHGESEIYDTVVRLHVVANSDSDEDQALKLEVRDAIIGVVAPAVEGCTSQSEAIAAIGGILDDIEREARRVVRERGYGYDVKVDIGEEYYPTKTYESCAFPEGKYVSLRVLIGEAEGQNWWCCLFPSLCLSASGAQSKESNEDKFISVGLSSDQYKIITESENPKYKARFKILEAFSSWFGGKN